MKSVAVVLAVAVAAFLVMESGLAIKCFVCNSYHQQDCADWFDNVTQHLTQCDEGVHMCRKVIQEAYYDGQYDVRYIRQCAKEGVIGAMEGRVCEERSGTWKVKVRYCHCDNQDGCNAAPTQHSDSAAVTLFLGAVTLWLLACLRS